MLTNAGLVALCGPGLDETLWSFVLALKRGVRKHDLQAAVVIQPAPVEELMLLDGCGVHYNAPTTMNPWTRSLCIAVVYRY